MKGVILDSYSNFSKVKEYEIPSDMQAVIACGRGFENLKVEIGSAKVKFEDSAENKEKIISAIQEAGYKVV